MVDSNPEYQTSTEKLGNSSCSHRGAKIMGKGKFPEAKGEKSKFLEDSQAK